MNVNDNKICIILFFNALNCFTGLLRLVSTLQCCDCVVGCTTSDLSQSLSGLLQALVQLSRHIPVRTTCSTNEEEALVPHSRDRLLCKDESHSREIDVLCLTDFRSQPGVGSVPSCFVAYYCKKLVSPL